MNNGKCGGSVSNRSYSLFIAFFILTLTFSLISAGILNVNTTIGMAAYAKKSKRSSESGDDGGGGGSSGDDSSGGSDSKGSLDNSRGRQ